MNRYENFLKFLPETFVIFAMFLCTEFLIGNVRADVHNSPEKLKLDIVQNKSTGEHAILLPCLLFSTAWPLFSHGINSYSRNFIIWAHFQFPKLLYLTRITISKKKKKKIQPSSSLATFPDAQPVLESASWSNVDERNKQFCLWYWAQGERVWICGKARGSTS